MEPINIFITQKTKNEVSMYKGQALARLFNERPELIQKVIEKNVEKPFLSQNKSVIAKYFLSYLVG